jgi:hypothetical protein
MISRLSRCFRRSDTKFDAGGGIGGDCAPLGSNYDKFYTAAPGVAWELVIADTGHFQFLDKQSLVQQAICGQVRLLLTYLEA